MPGIADNDTAVGFVAKWTADSELVRLVPGGLQQGRLSSFQPNVAPGWHPHGIGGATAKEEPVGPLTARLTPYATFDVKQGAAPEQTTGDGYVDRRLVGVEIRGLKADVVLALKRARAVFLPRGVTLTIPDATFLAMWEVETDDLHEDPDTKAGEDVWIGSLMLLILTSRSYAAS